MVVASLLCPSCNKANPHDMRFCGYCGSSLPLLCPSCGQTVPREMSFCGYCGAHLTAPTVAPGSNPDPVPSLPDSAPTRAPADLSAPRVPAASPPPAQEERRLVTALFCDLVGFTPLSEQLDPEEVRDIQAGYFGRMAEQIERYGGSVEKYAGDAVLALFGAPVAHEDDAERAVLCALGMQAAIEPVAEKARTRWQVEPSIRVGVNTGEVVSGTWAASGRQDVAVTGDAINTAARLQAVADPGEVLVGTETMRLTRRRIRYGPTRDLALKGKVGTVPTYAALGVREEFGERWEEAPRVSPLVGRDRELVQLLDAWMRAQGAEGQLLTVVGEPGVGKSRLVAETVERISCNSAVRIIRARSLSYGQEISLWLVADLLRSLFGIREQAGPEDVRVTLGAAVRVLLAGSDEATQIEAFDVLGEVLGLPLGTSMVAQAGPQIRRTALLRTIRLLLGALSERAATIVVMEDLHWIDAASQEVLKEVLSDVPGLRLLVLAAQRPGWTAPWSDWGWTERLTLRPLRQDDAAILAGSVLGGKQLSAELQGYVAERAGGNPFFVEEMLRSLDETGGLEQRDGVVYLVQSAADRLPSTLTEVLLARLDRLDGQVRNIAQVGSVIGRSFGVRLLAQVMEQEQTALELPLVALQQAEIAFPQRGPDLEYVFRHVSMREVAYNTLISRRRQELHLQTARAIAALYPLDEYVEIVAYHYARTEEHAEAAIWLERAGDRAAGIYAVEEAIGHYRESMERRRRCEDDPLVLARLDEKLGGVLFTAGRYDDALLALERAVQIYHQARDLEAAGRATARMGTSHRWRGTPEEGITLVEPMVELLSWSGPSQALASLHLALANLYLLVGKYREMLAAAERAAELARSVGDGRLLGEAEERRGVALIILGQPGEGRRVIEGALPLVEAGGDLVVLWLALSNLGEACKHSGNIAGAHRYTEQGVEVAERIGNLDSLAFVLANLGDILMIRGEWERARVALERALALARGGGRSATLSVPLSYLGQLCLWEGDREEAARYLREALAAADDTHDRQAQEEVQALLADLDLLDGRPGDAMARLQILVAKEDAALGRLLPPFAQAQFREGNRAAALESAIKAVERTRGHEPVYLVDALRVASILLLFQGQIEGAMQFLDEGLEVARFLPHPYAEARFLYHLGLCVQRLGKSEQARQRLEESQSIFRRLGARNDVARTEQALAELAEV